MIKAISPNVNFTKKQFFKSKTTTNQNPITTKNNLKINKKQVIAGAVALSLLALAVAKRKNIAEVFSTLFNKDKPTTFEKPKYLYHMTSKAAYESIMNDGKINMSNMDEVLGVYLSSADDIRCKYTKNDLLGMINFYDGGNWANPSPHEYSGKVYILEIPVEKLDNDSILFRNISLRREMPEVFEGNWQRFKDFSDDRFSEIIKNPIEFLFRGEISTDKISKVFEIDSNRTYTDDAYIAKIFKKLKK